MSEHNHPHSSLDPQTPDVISKQEMNHAEIIDAAEVLQMPTALPKKAAENAPVSPKNTDDFPKMFQGRGAFQQAVRDLLIRAVEN